MQPRHGEIAKLAYQLYLEDGRPEGRAQEFWLRAEALLLHPEAHPGYNILAVPSEPELTRALDEKAHDLDTDLPSDPHTGREAVHQRVELAVDRKEKRQDLSALKNALKQMQGIEKVEPETAEGRVVIHFDARRTNPAAIHEAIIEHGYHPSDLPQR